MFPRILTANDKRNLWQSLETIDLLNVELNDLKKDLELGSLALLFTTLLKVRYTVFSEISYTQTAGKVVRFVFEEPYLSYGRSISFLCLKK